MTCRSSRARPDTLSEGLGFCRRGDMPSLVECLLIVSGGLLGWLFTKTQDSAIPRGVRFLSLAWILLLPIFLALQSFGALTNISLLFQQVFIAVWLLGAWLPYPTLLILRYMTKSTTTVDT